MLAASSASFTTAYTRAGLCPDGSSTHYLPRLIGQRRVQELIFTNRRLSADEAQGWGLIHRVVPAAALAEEAAELAQRLAAGPRGAHGAVKRLLLDTFRTGLEEQMELEGVAAFVEKRPPVFPGPRWGE